MIVTTVVLTNAVQAKCFPLSLPITYEATHQILNLNCVLSQNGDQWNLVSNTNIDLRTASQFRHGA